MATRNGIHVVVECLAFLSHDRRITIQLAADAEWPYRKPENAGIRREFQLLPDRPFNGRGSGRSREKQSEKGDPVVERLFSLPLEMTGILILPRAKNRIRCRRCYRA
jgi:hypothetical protein